MRTTLMCAFALKNDVGHIVIPPFGGGCGRVPSNVIAKMMYEGYLQIALRCKSGKF